VVVITVPAAPVDSVELADRRRETLCLTWEERRWTRRRVVTSSGREVGLALPTGSVLQPGDIVAVETDWYLQIEARPEPVLAVTPRNREEAIRLAFDVGNRHFPLAVEGADLLVPDDTAMEQLLVRLGFLWRRCTAVFAPLGGAQAQDHGRSALDGHSHGHPHLHEHRD